MTRAEQEAFEKWKLETFGDSIMIRKFGLTNEPTHLRAFLAGYRACRRVQAMEHLIEAGAEQMEQEERK